MNIPTANLELVKGENNFFDLDLTSDIDVADDIWFTAKYRKSDTDAEAALLLTRDDGSILVTDAATGKAQVQVSIAQSAALTGRGLVYDVKIKKADVSQVTTVVAGVIRLVDSVNVTAV